MNKDERSLLLYLETRAVDYGGLVDTRHMNDDDNKIAEKWNETEFIQYSRITIASLNTLSNKHQTHAVFLSDDAWKLAHEERLARNKRMIEKRTWVTTNEKIETNGICSVRLGLN